MKTCKYSISFLHTCKPDFFLCKFCALSKGLFYTRFFFRSLLCIWFLNINEIIVYVSMYMYFFYVHMYPLVYLSGGTDHHWEIVEERSQKRGREKSEWQMPIKKTGEELGPGTLSSSSCLQQDSTHTVLFCQNRMSQIWPFET